MLHSCLVYLFTTTLHRDLANHKSQINSGSKMLFHTIVVRFCNWSVVHVHAELHSVTPIVHKHWRIQNLFLHIYPALLCLGPRRNSRINASLDILIPSSFPVSAENPLLITFLQSLAVLSLHYWCCRFQCPEPTASTAAWSKCCCRLHR